MQHLPFRMDAMEPLKHSGLGIASFVLALLSGLMILVMLVIAGVVEASTPGGMDEQSGEAIAIGLSLFAFLGGALVSLGLGVAGLIQGGRKKLFAILGTVISGVALLCTGGLILIGLMAG